MALHFSWKGGAKAEERDRERKREEVFQTRQKMKKKNIDVSDSYKSFFLFFSSGLLYGEYLGEDRGKMKISEEESD